MDLDKVREAPAKALDAKDAALRDAISQVVDREFALKTMRRAAEAAKGNRNGE